MDDSISIATMDHGHWRWHHWQWGHVRNWSNAPSLMATAALAVRSCTWLEQCTIINDKTALAVRPRQQWSHVSDWSNAPSLMAMAPLAVSSCTWFEQWTIINEMTASTVRSCTWLEQCTIINDKTALAVQRRATCEQRGRQLPVWSVGSLTVARTAAPCYG